MAHFGVRKWRGQPRRLDRKPTREDMQSGRKPLGPPIGDSRSKRRNGIIPFDELPVHVQAAQAAARRSAGDYDE